VSDASTIAETAAPAGVSRLSGLAQRVLVAAIGIPLLVVLIFWGDGTFFAVAVAVLAVAGLVEFYRGVRLLGACPAGWLGALTTLVFLGHAYVSAQLPEVNARFHESLPLVLTALFIIALIYETFRGDRRVIRDLSPTLLGAFYVGWLFRFLISLRLLPGEALPLPTLGPLRFGAWGAWVVLYLMVCTWMADTGAYFVGRRLGRHKLAPRLSPNKTIEGLAGGIATATLAGWLVGTPVLHLPWWLATALGLLMGVLGPIGDLCKSAMKREMGIKDFGAALPGHGGVLDRFDSLLVTAPAVYALLVALRDRL
jgi:phosphatidate cytidylyltransferase